MNEKFYKKEEEKLPEKDVQKEEEKLKESLQALSHRLSITEEKVIEVKKYNKDRYLDFKKKNEDSLRYYLKDFKKEIDALFRVRTKDCADAKEKGNNNKS